MLYVFAGGHRMGSHFQTFVVRHALRQVGLRFKRVDSAAMHTFHLAAIRKALTDAETRKKRYFIAKAHAAFPIQIDALLSARTVRVFLIWRPHRDCLVSDYHFAVRSAGHSYADFDHYFRRRGRRVLLRNRLQEVAWAERTDPRVYSCQYLDLRDDFAHTATEMLDFARIEGVDIGRLEDSLQIGSLRNKYRDPDGRFFRKGGAAELAELERNDVTLAEIAEIEMETSIEELGARYLQCDRWKSLIFGSEAEEAGLRKTVQTWLYRFRSLRRFQRKALPAFRKFSP